MAKHKNLQVPLFGEKRSRNLPQVVIEREKKRKTRTRQEKRKQLEHHLVIVTNKLHEEKNYNTFSLLEKRIYCALVDWHNSQSKIIPNGKLELLFRKTSLINLHFRQNTFFNETRIITWLKALKSFQKKMYTFVVLNGQIEYHGKSIEGHRVLNCFKFYKAYINQRI